MKRIPNIKGKKRIVVLSVGIVLVLGIILFLFLNADKESSDSNKIDTSKSNKLTGIVIKENLYNYLIDDNGREIEVPKTNKSNTELDLKTGDEIRVFYDGKLSNRTPAQMSEVVTIELIKKADKSSGSSSKKESDSKSSSKTSSSEESTKEKDSTQEDEESSEVTSKEKTKYYNMPVLSISSKSTSRLLANNESALVYDLMDSVDWDESKKELNADYTLKVGNETVFEFDSKEGLIRDSRKDKVAKIQSELSSLLKEAIEGNI